MSGDSAELRAAAARVVRAVMRGRSLDRELPRAAAALPEARRATLRVMCHAALRDHRRLAALLERMVERPPPADSLLHALLVVGLAQLLHLHGADHADVNETVHAARRIGAARAAGMVNAVLRRFLRERDALLAALPDEPGLRHSYPDWLVEALRRDWGDRLEQVLAAGNAPPPLTLRVNRRRTDPETMIQRLTARGVGASPVPGLPEALVLDAPMPVSRLPGYAEGWFSVQDASAQFAAAALAARPGMRVLDACAAPGGKTGHLLEQVDDIALTAVEREPARLRRMRENLDRLGLSARLIAGDVCTPQQWWDGEPYDRILLDAPCTGTGVIRRHPDIKWLRRAQDVPVLAATQLAMLRALWDLLAPGGVLLYATCSILSAEGDAVIDAFVQDRHDARTEPIEAPIGQAIARGLRIAPGGAHDGFYYARLRKPVPGTR